MTNGVQQATKAASCEEEKIEEHAEGGEADTGGALSRCGHQAGAEIPLVSRVDVSVCGKGVTRPEPSGSRRCLSLLSNLRTRLRKGIEVERQRSGGESSEMRKRLGGWFEGVLVCIVRFSRQTMMRGRWSDEEDDKERASNFNLPHPPPQLSRHLEIHTSSSVLPQRPPLALPNFPRLPPHHQPPPPPHRPPPLLSPPCRRATMVKDDMRGLTVCPPSLSTSTASRTNDLDIDSNTSPTFEDAA